MFCFLSESKICIWLLKQDLFALIEGAGFGVRIASAEEDGCISIE
jgi:hypothetical protein